MFKCPLCQSSTRYRGHCALNDNLHEWTNQCTNVYCGHCFTTREEFDFSDNRKRKRGLELRQEKAGEKKPAAEQGET